MRKVGEIGPEDHGRARRNLETPQPSVRITVKALLKQSLLW
jgi:hypothetical protein